MFSLAGSCKTPRSSVIWAALFCLVFLASGLAVIPYPGIQQDEALFAMPLYPSGSIVGEISIFKRRVPLMLMSYLGTLKTGLYAPIFQLWPPSPWAIRVPALVAGAASIWLFHRLLLQTIGSRAALIGAALLAFDTSYLLTTVLDWGPVALQHLLLIAAMLALARFHQSGSRRALAAGFAFLGLGLWDKALFIWALGGLMAAGLAVFPREIRRAFSMRNLRLAAAFFCLGALPFLLYNVRSRGGTAHATGLSFSAAEIGGKLRFLGWTLDGSTMFGYAVRDGAPVLEARNPLECASVWISNVTREPRAGLTKWALIAALLLAPFVRAVRFAAIFMAVAWIQMAVTIGAGGASHHTILLWPMPQLVIAAALAWLPWRTPAVVVAAGLCVASLSVTNQHLAQWIRVGPASTWTDAIYPLLERLRNANADRIVVLDWGMFDNLRVLSGGRLNLRWGTDPKEFPLLVKDADTVFISRLPGAEEFTDSYSRAETLVAEAGFQKRAIEIVRDRHGRPVFEVFRLAARREDRSLTVAPQ